MITTVVRRELHAAVSMNMVTTALVGDVVPSSQPHAAMITLAAALKNSQFVTLMLELAYW